MVSDKTYTLTEILVHTLRVRSPRLAIAQVREALESPFPDDRRSGEALALLRSKRQAFTMREVKVIISNFTLRDILTALTWVSGELHHGVPYTDDTWEAWLDHDDWGQPPE